MPDEVLADLIGTSAAAARAVGQNVRVRVSDPALLRRAPLWRPKSLSGKNLSQLSQL